MAEVIHSVIFGYAGKARSGKDTAAKIISCDRGLNSKKQRTYPNTGEEYDIRIYSFAQELKREVTAAALACGGMKHLFTQPQEYVQANGNFLPLPEHIVYDENAPMDDPYCPLGKQRLFLQWYGQEYRRSVNPTYWIDKVAQRIAEDKPEVALISDVRYLNEVAFCQEFGEVIRVSRASEHPPLHGAAGAHASETELDSFKGWDDWIINSGTLEEFRERVLFSFDSLMSTHPLQRSTLV